MTANVTMYSTLVCPYCVRAERLLESKGVSNINKIRVDLDPAQRQLIRARRLAYRAEVLRHLPRAGRNRAQPASTACAGGDNDPAGALLLVPTGELQPVARRSVAARADE